MVQPQQHERQDRGVGRQPRRPAPRSIRRAPGHPARPPAHSQQRYYLVCQQFTHCAALLSSGASARLWESRMRLSKNFVSGQEVYVSSAKSNDDPATGGFTYRCDPSVYPQTVIKEGGSFRYKGGPWNGVSFSGTPNLGLLEGQDIAVKRLSTTSLQGAHEFKNELIYQVKRRMLDWPRRFDIINGIARGLTYLHQDPRLRVIHRDHKASNILLDSDMIPKISDFGLARICGGNETGAKTSRAVGTHGYMSPEYAVDGLFSVKSDVFSFGVLVLEIISGNSNRGFTLVNHRHNLLGHCVQEETEERPNMSSVVLMLNNDGVLPQPKHPGFFTGRDVVIRSETWHSSNTAGAANAMTIFS
ncbi:hypothetical protein SASPL_144542 [Salvia splendens]|uniref:non-specific serine/threonine protein kinase n=1 Tax=Salvia splendens TaxID=180675 RepID=A0A8X8WFY3_SALSN|nr:hypothetical protein SASPL_144542 [Salvia splendens]